MPWLTDAYGLYYNTDMFKKAGITEPPKTTSQLFEDAKKLTVFNPDGSIKVAGFVPYFGSYYAGNTMSPFGTMYGGEVVQRRRHDRGEHRPRVEARSSSGRSSSSTSTGYGNLQKFVAGQGDEWGSRERLRDRPGRDDDRRGMADLGHFLGDPPAVPYGTAPMPVWPMRSGHVRDGSDRRDDHRDPEGVAAPRRGVAARLRGWPRDTPTLVYVANLLRNVPTTLGLDGVARPGCSRRSSRRSWTSSRTRTRYNKGASAIGSADQDLMANFFADWQAGEVPDLQAGLDDVAKQINDQLAQAATP